MTTYNLTYRVTSVTGMLDEVISIVGVATCSYFWGEVRREEMIFGRNVDED